MLRYPALLAAISAFVLVMLVSDTLEAFFPPLTASALAGALIAVTAVLAGGELLRRGWINSPRDYWLSWIAALAAVGPVLFQLAAYVGEALELPQIIKPPSIWLASARFFLCWSG